MSAMTADSILALARNFMECRVLLTGAELDLFTLLTLSYRGVENPLDQIKQILEDHQLIIQFITYTLEPVTNVQTYRLRLQSKDTISFKQVLGSLAATAGLQELHWQEGEVP